jgi:membrane protease YdiL (CAAX protease family)
MNMIWAAAVSALCFGLIHPYTPAGLIEVAAGGFVYALIRAWRGSLIAPVVAHALHNTVASSLDVYFVTMLGD